MDSREYEWSDITVVIGGRDITGIRGIKYKEEIERELIYAKGKKPHSVQSGNFKYGGEIQLLRSELDALIKSGNGSILNLKGVDVIVSYGNATAGDAVTTDRLEGVYFSESEKGMNNGDKFEEISLPIIFSGLKQQV